MTEGQAFDNLCSDVGLACDKWQEGKVTDQKFINLVMEAAQRWLADQIANTPK